jgi:molecular chaperone DnaK
MSVAIGIDLGTTNTVVAAVVDGVAVTLEDDQGRRLLPSVVSFHPSSTVLVGEAARERRLIDPENTIYSVKPLLGRSWESEEVHAARSRFPFKLVQGSKNSTNVVARDVSYALTEISAFVLRRAKSIAEAALGQVVDRAVITVPANFNDLQRASTKIAGKLAGLDVMRILNEPTAAALAYGQSISKAEKIAVYDLGGGTFDVTLLDLTGNVFEVLATAGDTALGGDDIDRVIADKMIVDVMNRFNVDPRTNPASAARLGFMAEEIKKELSTAYQAHREITGLGYAEGGNPITLPFKMTREELETLVKPLIERTIAVAQQSIDVIGFSPRDFDRVILVGGSTRMPLVARMVEKLFGAPPHLKVNPDEVVALGAAIQAHALNRSKGAHKRSSAHDQLAKAQPNASGDQVPTRPPDANPNVTPADVPKPAPLPTLGTPAAAPAAPAFFTFNKAPAVISFSQASPTEPGAPNQQAALDQPAPKPAAPNRPAPKPADPKPAAPKPALPKSATTVMATSPAAPRPPPVPKPRAQTLPLSPEPPRASPPAPVASENQPDASPPELEKWTASLFDLEKRPDASPPVSERRSAASLFELEKRPDASQLELEEPAGAPPLGLEESAVASPLGLKEPAAASPLGSEQSAGASRLGLEEPTGASPLEVEARKDASPLELGERRDALPSGSETRMSASSSASENRIAAASPTRRSVPEIPSLEVPAAPRQSSPEGMLPAPELDLPLPSGPPPAEMSAMPSGGLEELVMTNEFFNVPAATPERFHRGSAIATSARAPLLIDVTPLSLGVETAGGYTDILIPANSPVPCEKTRTFLTGRDGQTVVSIRVAQGESSRFAANTRLGDLELSGLRQARRGEVKIAVTFELDADGILNVRALDTDTGRETAATMRLLGANTDVEDVGAMAERHARHNVV